MSYIEIWALESFSEGLTRGKQNHESQERRAFLIRERSSDVLNAAQSLSWQKSINILQHGICWWLTCQIKCKSFNIVIRVDEQGWDIHTINMSQMWIQRKPFCNCSHPDVSYCCIITKEKLKLPTIALSLPVWKSLSSQVSLSEILSHDHKLNQLCPFPSVFLCMCSKGWRDIKFLGCTCATWDIRVTEWWVSYESLLDSLYASSTNQVTG